MSRLSVPSLNRNGPVRLITSLGDRALFFKQWFLAYRFGGFETGPSVTLSGLTHLFPPTDRKWADPFPVTEGGRFYIFMEELVRKTGKGHLSVLEIDPSGVVDGPVPILETEYHLSYPFVFKWRDEYFMVPESRRNRTVDLYRCTAFPFGWEHVDTLIDDVGAVDATLEEINGRWWMFTSIAPDGASAKDELHLLYADSPLGPWQRHAGNPVKSDRSSARPAGRIFRAGGELYRPSQDCSAPTAHDYAVTVNRIVRIDTSGYEETEAFKILPNWAEGLIATHTFNVSDGLVVVDGLRRRGRFL